MKAIRNIIYLTVLTALAAGCGKENATVAVQAPSSRVCVTAGWDSATRGSLLEEIPSFSMFGYKYTSAIGKADFMYNESMTKSSGRYISSSEHKNVFPGTSMYFWAVAPQNAAGVTLPTSEASGTPSFTYVNPSAVASQQDLILADKTTDGLDPDMHLVFSHALSALKFKFSSEGGFEGTVRTISINNIYTSATYTLGSGWSGLAGKQTRSVTVDKAFTAADADAGITGGESTLILLPQTLPSDATISVEVQETGSAGSKTLSASLSGYGLQKGSVHTISLSISDCLVVSGVTLEAWGAGKEYERELSK